MNASGCNLYISTLHASRGNSQCKIEEAPSGASDEKDAWKTEGASATQVYDVQPYSTVRSPACERQQFTQAGKG